MSITTYTMQTAQQPNSSTWAASVPMNLAEAITAAVGLQPVPQLPAKQVLQTAAQLQEPAAQQLQTQQHGQAPLKVQPSHPTASSPADLYPFRRPTAAEARAASPPVVVDGLQQELLQDTTPAQAAYDDMDNLQLQDNTVQAANAFGSDAVASVHAAAHKATDLQAAQLLSQQQQHQLLSQLWSELQAPQPPAAQGPEGCCKLDLQAKPVVHLHATNSGHLSTSNSLQSSSSSSCSSAQEAAGRLALAAAAAATAASAAAGASAGPDSPCGSVHSSRALSSCSTSSSKKRVSWGDPVVYQLPPEQPMPLLASVWQQVCDWWAPEDTVWHSGRHWSPAAATATAVLSVTAAAAVAACLARRVHRS
jgi:hypothetical protein